MLEQKIEELTAAVKELTSTIKQYQVPAGAAPVTATPAAPAAEQPAKRTRAAKAAAAPAAAPAPAAPAAQPTVDDNDLDNLIDDGFGDLEETPSVAHAATPVYTGANAGDALKALRDAVAAKSTLDKGREIARTVLAAAGCTNIAQLTDTNAEKTVQAAAANAKALKVYDEWVALCSKQYKLVVA